VRQATGFDLEALGGPRNSHPVPEHGSEIGEDAAKAVTRHRDQQVQGAIDGAREVRLDRQSIWEHRVGKVPTVAPCRGHVRECGGIAAP
jgi:hypothetical protein